MKCKVITDGRLSIEKEINEWLDNNKIEIFDITQSQNDNYVTVSIFYYDKQEIRKKKLEKLNKN